MELEKLNKRINELELTIQQSAQNLANLQSQQQNAQANHNALQGALIELRSWLPEPPKVDPNNNLPKIPKIEKVKPHLRKRKLKD